MDQDTPAPDGEEMTLFHQLPFELGALAVRVCEEAAVPLPPFSVRFRYDKAGTSGRTVTHPARIHLTLGEDEDDQRITLLHELAHYLCNLRFKGQRVVHGPEFWVQAFDLFEKYLPEVPRLSILRSEGSYREGALREAQRRAWHGAREALAARRDWVRQTRPRRRYVVSFPEGFPQVAVQQNGRAWYATAPLDGPAQREYGPYATRREALEAASEAIGFGRERLRLTTGRSAKRAPRQPR